MISRRTLPAWIPAAVLISAAGCHSRDEVAPAKGALKSSDVATLIVDPAVQQDTSPPLASLSPGFSPATDEKREHPVRPLPQTTSAPGLASDPVIQSHASGAAAPAAGAGFAGVGHGDYGFADTSAPPDTNLAVGPNHIIQIVNTSFAIFSKTGTLLQGPTATNTLWSGFGGGCQTNNDGDATVVYDQIADRFIFTQFSVSTTPYLECVAISTTGNPTGTYYRYAFQYGNFPDYPKLSVWPDAYYVSFNMFKGNTFQGSQVCAYDRGKMLTGAAATQVCFALTSTYGGLLPSYLDGTTPPPAGSPNYILNFTAGVLNMWKFHADFGTPTNSTFTGPVAITVAAFSAACNGGVCIPQSGTSQKLDSLADRLMYRLAYRNFGDHEALVVNHSVTAGTSVGVRWYEVRNPATAPTIFQQGTFAPDSKYRWMGSAAMDHMGNIGVGYSVSSGSMNPAIAYTGRLTTDPLGTLQPEVTMIAGTGSQTRTLSRWGDYSALAVDPSDDCTFWYSNEYLKANGTFNWSTRIGSFKFSGCTTGGGGVDAAPDGGVVDAAPDAPPDLPHDTAPDAAPDLPPDLSPDTAPDAGAPPSPLPPTTADFDGDNRMDIGLTANTNWASLPVARANGAGGFDVTNGAVGEFPTWATYAGVSVLAGDFTGDGRTDVALTGGSGWAGVPVAVSTGGGSFNVVNAVLSSFASSAPGAGRRLVGDFDGDGKADIALTAQAAWASMPVAYGNGDGTFTERNDVVGEFSAWAASPGVSALVGDFDGDGRMDVAITGNSTWASVPLAFSEGRGPFTIVNMTAGNFPSWASSAPLRLIGDYDGDGKADIALLGGPGWLSIPIAFSRGRGVFSVTNAAAIEFTGWAAGSGAKVVTGDFNGDHKTDLALVGGNGWRSVPVALSNGDGSFTAINAVVGDFGDWAQATGVARFVGDFDGDGKADIAVSGGTGWQSVPVARWNGAGFDIINAVTPGFAEWSTAAGSRIIAAP